MGFYEPAMRSIGTLIGWIGWISSNRAEVIDLCRLTEDQAWQLLKRLVSAEKLVKHGEWRWSFYTLPGND